MTDEKQASRDFMVERVARAMFEVGQTGAHEPDVYEDEADWWREFACTAVKAMREPTVGVARALWENWRSLPIAASPIKDCDFDELMSLAELPKGWAARALRDAVYIQARTAIEAYEAALGEKL